jgi:pimeloyl-ACP methyl ester carboxylesterase
VRKAIYAECPPGVRLVAHERAAEVLAGQGAPATARGHHVAASARRGDVEVVEGAGHFVSLDQPERFDDIVRRFLAPWR